MPWVVGAAFTAVVNALVSDIITPLLGLITPKAAMLKTSPLRCGLPKCKMAPPTPAIVMTYGNFLQTLINFIIVSLAIFVIFKLMSMARKSLFREGEDAVPQHEKSAEERLLEEIRDLLKKKALDKNPANTNSELTEE